MENMEKYREKLKLENRVTALLCVILAVFCLIMALSEAGVLPITPATGDGHYHSRWRGFCCGAATGILLVMLFFLVRSVRAMKDEKQLKKLYIKENDERCNQIFYLSRAQAMRTLLILGIIGFLVASYFNMLVGFTILGCTMVGSVLCLGFQAYYQKKF